MIVSSRPDLEALVDRLRSVSQIAIDCEFQGEGRYHPLLCLVQLYFEENGQGVGLVIDPFEVDLEPLGEILADEHIEKLFHSGENDIPLLVRATGRPVRNVFDTQIAASFTGHGASPSYVALVDRLCSVRLSKTSRFTDWTKRPLDDEQYEYALDDVRYLPSMVAQLKQALDERGRLGWVEGAVEDMLQNAHQPRDRERLYLRLGPHRGMSPRQLAVLREMAIWRDARAEELDRPPGRIVSDDVLKQLGRTPPRRGEDLSQRRGMKGVGRAADALAAVAERAMQLPESELPEVVAHRQGDERVELVSILLGAVLRLRAAELEIAPTIIATRAGLDALAEWHFGGRMGAPPDFADPAGWKFEAAGRLLLEFLNGRYSLGVDADAPGGTRLIASV
jgi:ribonuclease D